MNFKFQSSNFKVLLFVSLFSILYALYTTPSAADTHGYGQGTCGAGSICYTGSGGQNIKPGQQCGTLTDWHYGFDSNNKSQIARCWLGLCCDPNTTNPTPSSPPSNTMDFSKPPPSCGTVANGKCTQVQTAIGNLSTDPSGFVNSLFKILLGFAGGVAILLIIGAGYQMMMSQGNPEKVKGARESLTAAIVGLVFIIFSVAILQTIGVQILQIPGLK